MRTIIQVLFILALLGASTGIASAQCVDVKTTRAQAVKINSPGYMPVAVLLKVSVPSGDAEAKAQKAFYRFWIAGSFPTLRRDVDWNMQEIKSCSIPSVVNDRRMLVHKTYLKVRAEVLADRTSDTSYVLGAALWLPKKLVAAKPQTGATLNSGASYTGEWKRQEIGGRMVHTLVFE
jgi:hypothetical protein